MPKIAQNTPPLCITMGEVAGIGPELIASIWQQRSTLNVPPFFVAGSLNAFAPYGIAVKTITQASEAAGVFANHLPLLEVGEHAPLEPGVLTSGTGAATIAAIQAATALALSGEVAAIVTAPIHKQHLQQSGFAHPGHTEFLADLCGLPVSASIMMLAAPGLRVVPVTVHTPLKNVALELTADKIIHAARTTHSALIRDFGITDPRIALAGLNPHAGEGGMLGMEEGTHIQPAIWALEDMGIKVSGPHSADTLFHADARAGYDAAICMYHDQALIPVKMLDFWGGVNITLGLPVVRTSPDHGTALEVAGRGLARPDSMIAAIRTAHSMSKARAKAA